MPIRLLDKEVVARIAAGEVVERPASVVKELVENALDAGSTQITAEAGGGGISLIRVSDDGSGIPAGEIGNAFQRYATSKISSLDDLQSIHTLGFRGEALASIAAAADMEVVTCAAGEKAGSLVKLENGAVVSRGEVGRPRGTTVTVRNLFRRVPARLKFLKSTSTESSHIINVVTQYALAFPQVKFTLSIDGKTALATPGRGNLMDSIIAAYGIEVAQNMLEVRGEGGAIQVSGMVGSPAISRSNRNSLSFFVNRRWVNSRLLGWAVEEAYHGLLMTGKHPMAIIAVSVPGAEVDVNIHPTKSDVRFQNEHAVFGVVQKAVRRTLIEQSPVPRIEEVAAPFAAPPRSQPPRLFAQVTHHQEATHVEAEPPLAAYLPVLRVLGQAANAYIVAEGPDGLYIIDQHAAHERILFEKVKGERSRREPEAQSLLEPSPFEVEPRRAEAFRSRYRGLADFGFVIEPFGDATYLVRAVPGVLHGKDWPAMLRELAESEGGDGEERVAATIACHGAVRSGKALTLDEMRELVRQLEKVANPHTCPHSRPTIIRLTLQQLEKKFGRT